MSLNKSKGTVLDPGLCRCCGSLKKCRVLNEEYIYSGEKEVYSDMFVDCFGLLLSNLDVEITQRLICATCVGRLREACSFRQQVLLCEEKLLKSEIRVHAEDKQEFVVKEELLKDDGKTCETSSDFLNDKQEFVVKEELLKDDGKTCETSSDFLNEQDEGDDTNDASSLESDHISPIVDDNLPDKMQMLADIKQTRLKLKKMQRVKKKTQREPNSLKEDYADDSQKALHNTIKIIENSFVCPFYTFYNDFYCSYCNEKYTDPEKLKDHVTSHDPKSYANIASKKRIAQIDISRIDCRLCPIPINDLKHFKSHITNEHRILLYENIKDEYLTFRLKINNFVCTECKAVYRFFHSLKKHMASHFGTFTCDICGTHFFYQRLLFLHQKSHDNRIISKYECNECGKSFSAKHSRNIHVARVHTKEAIFDCSKCDESFFTETQRYRHMKDAHGEERSYSCDQCDRVYDLRRALAEHVRKKHLKLFKHECDICHRRFYLPSRLKEHMTSHTGERNYKCENCGKSYARLRALKVHMQTHHGEKKYICAVCGASFTQNVSLKNHVKKQHQGLKNNGFS